MGYKLNIRNGSSWLNLLEDTNIEISDVNGDFTSTTLDGVLAELASNSGGGSGYSWSTVSSNITAQSGDRYLVDTSSGSISITLPLTPTLGDSIGFVDLAGTFDVNNLTILRNGENIMGIADDMVLDTTYKAITIVYSDSTNGWRIDTDTSEVADQEVRISALEASEFGVGQTWQDMTGSRSEGVTYTNTTDRPILVKIQFQGNSVQASSLTVDGIQVHRFINRSTSAYNLNNIVDAVVPVGSTYNASDSFSTVVMWTELR